MSTGGRSCLQPACGFPAAALAAKAKPPRRRRHLLFNDSHFHLTNYVQQGTDAVKYVDEIMGDKVCRSTLFGIPLQQTWAHGNSGEFAPTYYLQTDAPLYYYSFTDAYIARAFPELNPEQQARLDPMITGFNPADMYAADHIRRVLETFPGVFTGIGEFTIHKEFVSSKVAGPVASLKDPALGRILDFAGEAGLVAILHNDIDMPFAKAGAEPVYPHADEGPAAPSSAHHDHLGPYGSWARGAAGTGTGDGGQCGAQRRPAPDCRVDGDGPNPATRVLRHLLGRGREICRDVIRVDHALGGVAQQVP
jgi:hypothetical protein